MTTDWQTNTQTTLMNCTNSITKITPQNWPMMLTIKKTLTLLLKSWILLLLLLISKIFILFKVHNKKTNTTLIMNIKVEEMMLVISDMNLNKFKSVETMDHMLKSIIKLLIINQLLINMQLLASIKVKFQSVLSKKISNLEKTFKPNSPEISQMMYNTLTLPKTQ